MHLLPYPCGYPFSVEAIAGTQLRLLPLLYIKVREAKACDRKVGVPLIRKKFQDRRAKAPPAKRSPPR